MATSTAEQMVRGTAALLATVGLQGASIREVVRATGAPRGSIYHHFPGGKADLVTRAIELVGQSVVELIEGLGGRPAVDVVSGFAGMWRTTLVRSDLGSGCAVAAVTVAADGELPEITTLTGEIFLRWQRALAAALDEGGLDAPAAAGLATTVLAAVEGALILARAQRSIEPFDRVVANLEVLARTQSAA
jgi:TetR/AcrR family transcriptional regulator, lmrAB and yxaGH operons repressor